ncbi:homeodomain-like protein, partial [Tanacetum coccineum]
MAEVVDDNGGVRSMEVDDNGGVQWRCYGGGVRQRCKHCDNSSPLDTPRISLVDQAKNRIGDWKNKSLSFAGRLQLCNSVLSSMQVYWASVLLIPKGIVYDIHQLIRGFLWCNGEYKRGKAKVALDVISLPKTEGGLVGDGVNCFSFGKKFGHFWAKIGNGLNISVMFDNWCKFSPLAKRVTPRDVSNAGFNMSCRVADFVVNGEWHWPLPWLMKAPNIGTLPAPSLDPNTCDLIQWKNRNGVLLSFSVSRAWEDLRPHDFEVRWSRVVWYSHCITEHAFHLWLTLRGSLWTQDKIHQWDVGDADLSLLCCPLCDVVRDSHCYHFLECQFASQVWGYVRYLAEMENVPPLMHIIIIRLISISHQRTTRSIIGRLIVAATSYFLWLERNNRLFKNSRRSPKEVRDMIMTT